MAIGFALNEALALATAFTGTLALIWCWRRRSAQAKPWWVSWCAELFSVVALVFGCRVALADWMHVPSGSMEPTLQVGDVLLINHLAYGPRLPFTNTALPLGSPKRGDVVVFRHPDDANTFLVKRLVALPGDHVRFRDGVVNINDEPLQAQWLDEAGGVVLMRETSAGVARTLKLHAGVNHSAWECTVPAGHVLMLGDHRDNSADSRVWGFLPEREIYGRVDRVLVNFTDLSRTFKRL